MRDTLSGARARRWRVAAFVGIGVVCATSLLLQSAANADPASSSTGAGFQSAGTNHAGAHVNNGLSASLGPGTHYIYAQDATCPDGVDAFKVSGTTLTHIQTVGVGCSDSHFYGQHHLAVVRTPSNCLLLTDEAVAQTPCRPALPEASGHAAELPRLRPRPGAAVAAEPARLAA
jgi:hypothetical protein